MGKKNKNLKRKRSNVGQESLELLCNIQGYNNETVNFPDPLEALDTNMSGTWKEDENDVLESCLDEMECNELQLNNKEKKIYKHEDLGGSQMKKINFDGDLSILWDEKNNNENNLANYSPGKRRMRKKDEFEIPNIKVELTRHFQMGKISEYLLTSCKHLRMPSFERWVLDSKIHEKLIHEESIHSSKRSTLNYIDEVIPSTVTITDDASKRLLKEIITNNAKSNGKNNNNNTLPSITLNEAQQICQHLCHMATTASRQIQSLSSHLGTNQINSKNLVSWAKSSRDTLQLELGIQEENTLQASEIKFAKPSSKDDDSLDLAQGQKTMYSLVYSRRKRRKNGINKVKDVREEDAKPFVVKINHVHYEKLRFMYNSVHATTDGSKSPFHVPSTAQRKKHSTEIAATKLFHHLVFTLLLRYSSLAGGQLLKDLRGGGMQGSIHSHVFDFLRNQFGPEYHVKECFASPLNAYLGNQYTSAFSLDLDWHFGSQGDFFSLTYNDEIRNPSVLEANPPFSPGIMDAMVDKMEEILDVASSKKQKVIFVVIVPTCQLSKGQKSQSIIQQFAKSSFDRMLRSKYFIRDFTIQEREHGYIEGSQHMRPTRYKDSSYDTSVILLGSQDNSSIDSYGLSKEFGLGLKRSFASLHSEETNRNKDQNS